MPWHRLVASRAAGGLNAEGHGAFEGPERTATERIVLASLGTMVEPEDKDDNVAYADHCGFAMPQPFARTSRCRAKEHQKENGPGQVPPS